MGKATHTCRGVSRPSAVSMLQGQAHCSIYMLATSFVWVRILWLITTDVTYLLFELDAVTVWGSSLVSALLCMVERFSNLI